MEESIFYDLIESKHLQKWESEIEEADELGFIKREKELKKELQAELNENGGKKLESFISAFENRMEYLYYNINIKILNFGIAAGMQLQKAFTEAEE